MSWQQITSFLPQLFILVVVVIGPIVKYIVTKAAEQQQKKRMLDAEQARQREMLRTGRDVNAERAAEEARQMREAIARQQAQQMAEAAERARQAADGQAQAEVARRQEQLRRLRERRQREQQGGGQQTQGGSPVALPNQSMPGRRGGAGRAVTRELWPGGPVVVVSGEERERAERFEETSGAAQARQEAPDQSFVQPIAQVENVRSISRSAPAASRTVREVSAKRGATVAGTPGVPLNAAQWRQAFVASQIFGRPGGLV